MTADRFPAEYYLRGQSLGLSCYENYSWHPEMTEPTARAILECLQPAPGDTLLDFGCARGYLVRVFRAWGYSAWGVDVSRWAVGEGADSDAKPYLSTELQLEHYDWLIAKDVFEHVPLPDLPLLRRTLRPCILRGALVIVPLSCTDGGVYVEPTEEKDTTHCVRMTQSTWLAFLKSIWPWWDWAVANRVPGIKDHRAASSGFGFFVGRTTEQT